MKHFSIESLFLRARKETENPKKERPKTENKLLKRKKAEKQIYAVSLCPINVTI